MVSCRRIECGHVFQFRDEAVVTTSRKAIIVRQLHDDVLDWRVWAWRSARGCSDDSISRMNFDNRNAAGILVDDGLGIDVLLSFRAIISLTVLRGRRGR